MGRRRSNRGRVGLRLDWSRLHSRKRAFRFASQEERSPRRLTGIDSKSFLKAETDGLIWAVEVHCAASLRGGLDPVKTSLTVDQGVAVDPLPGLRFHAFRGHTALTGAVTIRGSAAGSQPASCAARRFTARSSTNGTVSRTPRSSSKKHARTPGEGAGIRRTGRRQAEEVLTVRRGQTLERPRQGETWPKTRQPRTAPAPRTPPARPARARPPPFLQRSPWTRPRASFV